MSAPVLPAADHWYRDLNAAKALDRLAVAEFGQSDRDHHLCSEQRSQQARGLLCVRVDRNRYGWCVRDVLRDGLGNLSGNGSLEFAVEFALRLRAERPGNVEVTAWAPEAIEALLKTVNPVT